jgi:hypothetical protein
MINRSEGEPLVLALWIEESKGGPLRQRVRGLKQDLREHRKGHFLLSGRDPDHSSEDSSIAGRTCKPTRTRIGVSGWLSE